jgi:fumarate hydratase subunit alpha
MRTVTYQAIVEAVKKLCIEAATELPGEVLGALKNARDFEQNPLARSILQTCIENAELAASAGVPICQDTGFAVFFVTLGSEVRIEGGTLQQAINEGTRQGYAEGYLRKSIVSDPLFDRRNTGDNTPAVIHLSLAEGDRIEITLAPKGAGSENMSVVAMLTPSAGIEGVAEFVVKSVVDAGGNPCPPVIVGVGIGGTFEQVTLLAKKALLRPLAAPNPDPRYARLETDILSRINSSGTGPQGLGGTTTALAVHIAHMPCHIASLPVAVNLNCHAARHARCVL